MAGGTTTFGQAACAETLAERRSFLADGLTPVACQSCGTEVLVRKHSREHTSIQWTRDPATACPVYAELAAEGGSTALMNTCYRLVDSIAQAAKIGAVPIGDDEESAS
ncbi:MAG: hypothetical protein HOQ24_08750 [Mycobacteriaceae bacterium]|nr:hypothetical protein [Mycobacteriaceae bacterium]